MTDFTKKMKKEYTILCPDFFPTHMDLFEAIFRKNGYKLTIVRDEGEEVIRTGLKYVHNDMCYPAICSIGQLIYALNSGKYDVHKTALIFFQTGGGCRASNYIFLLRKALEELNLGFVPVISVSFTGLEKYSGFKITPLMIRQAFATIVYGDMLLLLKNQVAPYELTAGDADNAVKLWIKTLSEAFLKGRGYKKNEVKTNLALMADSFAAIPVSDKKLIKVGIVGEIYVKYSSFANRGLERLLSREGCEYMIPGVTGFLQYCAANFATDHDYYGGSFIKYFVGRTAEKILERYEGYVESALSPYPRFVAPLPFERVKRLAEKVIDRGVKMGEGWLLPAEIAELIEKGYDNVVCVQPFGCLPNHIVAKGTIRRIRELYPEANVFPVDYDAGASAVNQENRIKLMLSIARENAAKKEDRDTVRFVAERLAAVTDGTVNADSFKDDAALNGAGGNADDKAGAGGDGVTVDGVTVDDAPHESAAATKLYGETNGADGSQNGAASLAANSDKTRGEAV